MVKNPRFRPNVYTIVSRAIEEGVAYGLRRHDKYAERALTPQQCDVLADELSTAILNALCEVIDFGE